MMRVLAVLLRLMARILRLLPLKSQVALLSRQGAKPSLDYRLLSRELERLLPPGSVIVCAIEPESKNVARFVAGTCKQLLLACTSRVVVVDGYVPAVSIPPKDSRVFVIQLWHAMGAIKKFGYQCLDAPAGRSSAAAKAGRMHMNYDLIIAGTDRSATAYAQAFGYPPETVAPLGLPRIDYLLNAENAPGRLDAAATLRMKHPCLADGTPTILYAPTLRKGTGSEGWLTEQLGALAAACQKRGARIIVAGHPLDSGFDQQLLKAFPCIMPVEKTRTIDLLALAGCVITDYSAIAFEADAARVPLVFFVPDYDHYLQTTGLNILLEEEFPQRSFRNADAAVEKALALAHTRTASSSTHNGSTQHLKDGSAFEPSNDANNAEYPGHLLLTEEPRPGATHRIAQLIVQKLDERPQSAGL